RHSDRPSRRGESGEEDGGAVPPTCARQGRPKKAAADLAISALPVHSDYCRRPDDCRLLRIADLEPAGRIYQQVCGQTAVPCRKRRKHLDRLPQEGPLRPPPRLCSATGHPEQTQAKRHGDYQADPLQQRPRQICHAWPVYSFRRKESGRAAYARQHPAVDVPDDQSAAGVSRIQRHPACRGAGAAVH
ncbi:MAG: hypothetical protein ACD_75C00227G0001, partial [uncultured bacterium]